MKIALAQLNFHVGDFISNTTAIIRKIGEAREQGAELVVFAELAVCGYPPRDFLEFRDFIDRCEDSIHRIADACTNIAAIVGAPSLNPAARGKPLYNTAYLLSGGAILARAHKTLLPNYDVFDEYRYFEPNRLPYAIAEYRGIRIALTICEDLWNISDDPLYVRNPMDQLASLDPGLIINIAASPFHYDQPATRRGIMVRNALQYKLPVIYVNHVGAQTELIFDGGSMVVTPTGKIVSEMKRFEEDMQVFEFPLKEKEQEKNGLEQSGISLIRPALVLGIRDYFSKMGFGKAILGLSGGIDSAVTLVLATEALGPGNVRALMLPSRFSSDHSITDARALAENLGVKYDIISIEEAFRSMESTLRPVFGDLPFDLAEENIQARMRAVILMAMANKFGYILLNTSNKSEAAVGYGTLYGDMCGGLSVLGDVYKTQVYELARQINQDREIIPQNSVIKPPSAELRTGQKDSDSLPDYDILDRILYRYIEERKGPRELIAEGFDETIVNKVLKLVNTSEYKRAQTPPILRVSPKAFGMGRRMPIVAKYLS